MKYLLMLDTPFWLLVSLSLTTYIFALRRRMRGLNEPELWLPRRERRAHARKLLHREDEQYEAQQLEKYTQIITGDQPWKDPFTYENVSRKRTGK